MIVLDEQLDPILIEPIKARHSGKVAFINDLRLKSVVKDDAIAQLLTKTNNNPAFITIKVKDFWNKNSISQKFCVVCFRVPDSKIRIISTLLKALFRIPGFKTKKQRAGHVFRIDQDGTCLFYSQNNPNQSLLEL